MFRNIGKKIQHLVTVLFTICVILICLAAAATVIFAIKAGGAFFTGGDIAKLVVLVVLGVVLCVFIIWVSMLQLYAYGKIAECCEDMRNTMSKIEAKQNAAPPTPTVVNVPRPTSYQQCAACGTAMEVGTKFCPECGVPYGQTYTPPVAPPVNYYEAPQESAAAPVYEAPQQAATVPLDAPVYETPQQVATAPLAPEMPVYEAPVVEAPQYGATMPLTPEAAPQYGATVPLTPDAAPVVEAPVYATAPMEPLPVVNRCEYCGALLENGAVFCGSCGTRQSSAVESAPAAPQAKQCLNCGALLAPEAMFCANCGTRYSA